MLAHSSSRTHPILWTSKKKTAVKASTNQYRTMTVRCTKLPGYNLLQANNPTPFPQSSREPKLHLKSQLGNGNILCDCNSPPPPCVMFFLSLVFAPTPLWKGEKDLDATLIKTLDVTQYAWRRLPKCRRRRRDRRVERPAAGSYFGATFASYRNWRSGRVALRSRGQPSVALRFGIGNTSNVIGEIRRVDDPLRRSHKFQLLYNFILIY